MAGSKSDYLENKLLDGVLGGPQFTLPPTIFVALSTAAYSDAATGSSGLTEVLATNGTSTGYARAAMNNNSTSWPAAVTNVGKSNGIAITYSVALLDWGSIQSFYLIDALTGGNVLYGADLQNARLILQGDTASFAIGAITVQET